MRVSDYKNLVVVGCISTIIIFALAGCGNTMKGLETDIYEKRKVVSDFVNPVETPVKKETTVD